MKQKLLVVVFMLCGGFLHHGKVQAQTATADPGVFLDDPVVVKAAALLPQEYAVPVGTIKVVYPSKLPKQWQPIFKDRAGLQIPGRPFVYINAENAVYIAARTELVDKGKVSPSLYWLARVMAHEYGWHGDGNPNGIKGANDDEVLALNYEKGIELYVQAHDQAYLRIMVTYGVRLEEPLREINREIAYAVSQKNKQVAAK